MTILGNSRHPDVNRDGGSGHPLYLFFPAQNQHKKKDAAAVPIAKIVSNSSTIEKYQVQFCQLKKGLKVLSNDRNNNKSAVTKPNLKIAGLQLSACFGVSFSNFQIAKFSNSVQGGRPRQP